MRLFAFLSKILILEIILFPYFMQKYLLETIVFLSGFIVLTYEVVGARILWPYYGTSTFVWTAMIGIILASLSIGYYTGGRWADKKDADIETLSDLLWLSGVAIAITYIIRIPLLDALSTHIHDIRIGSIIAATLLFAPASILLGMMSPYAVRLRIDRLTSSGATIGMMSALGTLGSILGTFITGFYLIPHFGVSTLLALLPISLVLLAFFASPSHHPIRKVGSLLIILILPTLMSQIHDTHASIEIDTLYSHIRVYDQTLPQTGERLRTMGINIENHSTMSLDSDRLVNEYTKYYHLARHFFPGFQTGLMLGGAGYSFPKDYIAKYKDATLDVVEIDPGVTALAKKYFWLTDTPRMQIFHEDGRVFLNQNKKIYDVIFGDAFTSWYSVPYQLSTREAVEKKYNSLSMSGLVILNLISSIEWETGEFLRAEYATYKSVFPQVYIIPVNHPGNGKIFQNHILIALKNTTIPSWTSKENDINGYLSHVWTGDISDDMPILTDDFAPVDHYIGKYLKYFSH